MSVLWILVALGAVIGGFEMLDLMFTRNISAPQQAASAAVAIAWAVIPYVFARACQGVVNAEERRLERLIDVLKAYAHEPNPTLADVQLRDTSPAT